jgi:chemotaxis protein methyltransferase CheR
VTAGALANLIKKRCGIIVPDRKLDSLLAVVKAKHPGQTMDEAVRSLETGPGLPDWLISATTINETFFFRHPEQFKFVEEWVGANRGTGRMRVLCLGCSTGEEPYSLAMLMHKAVGAGNFEITAVDLDPQVLETAKAGRYPESSVFRTPAAYRDVLSKHVKRLQCGGAPRIEVDKVIRGSVRFVRGNLMSVPLGRYDFVMARNVLIYLSPEDRARVLERLRTHIPRSGVVIIGAGELSAANERWEPGHSTWCLRRAA